MLVTINMSNTDISRLVETSIHESIQNLCRMYDYGEYPPEVEADLVALNRVYQYYSGKELEH